MYIYFLFHRLPFLIESCWNSFYLFYNLIKCNHWIIINNTWLIFTIFAATSLRHKWSFPLGISSVMWLNPQFPADLVAFTEEILNGKLNFLCSACSRIPNIIFFTYLMFYTHPSTFIVIPIFIWIAFFTIKFTFRFAWYMFC